MGSSLDLTMGLTFLKVVWSLETHSQILFPEDTQDRCRGHFSDILWQETPDVGFVN